MIDQDPTASHDLAPLVDWVRAYPMLRGASFSLTWRSDGGEPWLHAELEIDTEAGYPIRADSDLDYGLATLVCELIAKTRPVSWPEPSTPRVILGPRSHVGGDVNRKHRKKVQPVAVPPASVDPCEEGEG